MDKSLTTQDLTPVNDDDKNTLSHLYALRAGLSVISQQRDKCNRLGKQMYESILEKAKYYFDEEYKEFATADMSVLQKQLSQHQDEKKQAIKGKIMNITVSIISFGLSVLFIILGIVGWNDVNISAISPIFPLPVWAFIISAVAVGFGMLMLALAFGSQELLSYNAKIKKDIESIKLFPQFKAERTNLVNDKDSQIALIKSRCAEYFNVLYSHYHILIDVRDWQHLDLIIFYFETRRADNLKEALQLVDREIQTQRIEASIQQAAEQICNTLKSGFAMIRNTLNIGFRTLSTQLCYASAQLADLSGDEKLCNALLEKAKKSSKQLIEDANYMSN